jgi:hypothetical protein
MNGLSTICNIISALPLSANKSATRPFPSSSRSHDICGMVTTSGNGLQNGKQKYLDLINNVPVNFVGESLLKFWPVLMHLKKDIIKTVPHSSE